VNEPVLAESTSQKAVLDEIALQTMTSFSRKTFPRKKPSFDVLSFICSAVFFVYDNLAVFFDRSVT
jgi:hypothetical protein